MATIMNVDGTYPLDGSNWSILSKLTVEEAAEFLGVEAPEDPDRHYLLLNKGYVVVDEHAKPKADPKAHNFGMTMAEMLTTGEVGGDWPAGAWAVYVHDGTYYLLERNRVCPRCKSKLAFDKPSEWDNYVEHYVCLRGCGAKFVLADCMLYGVLTVRKAEGNGTS